MGNRSQYTIGATIAAVAVVLSLVAILPAVSETPTQTTALNAMGHVTITSALSPSPTSVVPPGGTSGWTPKKA